jgi:AcrR family transcriptional regulator
MSEPTESGATDYRRFDTEADFQAAVDRLLEQDGRELRIFDPDLQALRLNAPDRVERLERFLLASRTRRLYVVVHDPEHLTRHCPRMMRLLARFAHVIQVNRTHEEIRELQDAFLVLDSEHYLRRPVARFFRGAIGIYDETEALAMRGRFNEIWSASFPAVSATTLGL